MTSIGSQDSLERTQGGLLRAMGTLFLGKKDCARESFARELRERRNTPRFDYCVRTLKRHLTGILSAVSPEV
jgi:hypothetical protein